MGPGWKKADKVWGRVGRNVSSQDGWLYFNGTHKRTRYSSALGMRDTPENRKKAVLIAKKIKTEMALDEFNPAAYEMFARYCKPDAPVSTLPTVETYADRWLDYKMERLAKSTYRDYKNLILKYLVPFLGTKHLDEIDRALLEKWLRWLDKFISRTYARDCLKRCKAILREAEEEFGINTGINLVTAYRIDRPANPDTDAIFMLEELRRPIDTSTSVQFTE